MKMNKIFATTVAAFISVSSFAQTVDEIVDKHIAAIGGADKLKSVNSIVTETSLSVNGMDIPMVNTVLVNKALRSESTVMGNSMVTVIDGTSGWMIRPTMMGGTGEPENLPADQLKQQMGQLDPFGPLFNYKEKGNKVELVGTEKVDKKDNYHLKITTKDGDVVDQYIDANTFLVTKSKASRNGQEAEISFSDYKTVDGIKIAHAMDISSQMGNIAFITNKVKINGSVDEKIFKKP
ncbi:outer membrane lipoprotein-sorting protein [Emticicia agri]|uniref:Outer membrane lipoprotein-sorting protein n=1 Tax=Emticicia agri TaxID=2492393 RepID=A0A4Q5M663_9BACT|nr:outer membrane lipoprotein-sorting protein [Emticicia agri]RYU97447.1 outer membrane lipoprotein-sorting protein [Emticicia agri]